MMLCDLVRWGFGGAEFGCLGGGCFFGYDDGEMWFWYQTEWNEFL